MLVEIQHLFQVVICGRREASLNGIGKQRQQAGCALLQAEDLGDDHGDSLEQAHWDRIAT